MAIVCLMKTLKSLLKMHHLALQIFRECFGARDDVISDF